MPCAFSCHSTWGSPPPQGYLLVYSVTDDTTFTKLDRLREEILARHPKKSVRGLDFHAFFWAGGPVCKLDALSRPACPPQVPIFLIGTKCDLAEDRAVEVCERTAKARLWGSPSFECSVGGRSLPPPFPCHTWRR